MNAERRERIREVIEVLEPLKLVLTQLSNEEQTACNNLRGWLRDMEGKRMEEFAEELDYAKTDLEYLIMKLEDIADGFSQY